MSVTCEKKKRLVHILNGFRSGAIPSIIRDVHPVISNYYDVQIVVLGEINYGDRAISDYMDKNIPVHALGCRRWDLARSIVRLRRLLADLEPDIIHAHMGRAELLAPLCRLPGTKVFATHHNVREGYHLGTRLLNRLTNRHLDGRTCVSNAVAESWYGANRHRHVTIHNPVDVERFIVDPQHAQNIRAEFKLKRDQLLLLAVGRINKQKAHGVLLRAVAELRSLGLSNFKLVIAGRGELEGDVRAEIRRLSLENQVSLAGFRDDIPALLSAADVFVLPSLWEGLPLAALEAMAAGVAIAASDLPSLRECIEDGSTGLLSPPGDHIALCRNISRILIDGTLRGSLGAQAREAVRLKFNARSLGEKYLALYQQ